MSKIRRIFSILFENKEEKINFIEEDLKTKESIALIKNHKQNYLTVLELAKYFHLTPNELNKIFQKLNWSKREEESWLMTNLGKYYGAKECYDNRNKIKYLKWDKSVKNSSQLMKAIEEFKKLKV